MPHWMINAWVGDLCFASLIGFAKAPLCMCVSAQFDEQVWLFKEQVYIQERVATKLLVFLFFSEKR